jgi:hypothetical protein
MASLSALKPMKILFGVCDKQSAAALHFFECKSRHSLYYQRKSHQRNLTAQLPAGSARLGIALGTLDRSNLAYAAAVMAAYPCHFFFL